MMQALTPFDITKSLLHRDGLILVIDKPYGLPVHKGPKGGVTLADHLHHLRFGLPANPELAHRLDRETSGCLVLGRHRKALAMLSEMFRNGKAQKTYWAVVEGGPDNDEGEIDLPLSPKDPKRGWWMKVDEKGQPSLTRYRVRGRANGLTWLELNPVTGRTHQLRVHCAAKGFPILGDPIYGTGPRNGPPFLHLHARAISLPMKKNGPPLIVEAPVPGHMEEALRNCGYS
jgi:tRNA pseudouridine32 synthase/23S rRNA pseudouridine746 synthase